MLVEAALKAILQRPFTVAQLQPEPTRPRFGAGWCGVFKWCREFAARSYASLEEDPTLPGFDLFVIHLDSDVAEMRYADGGAAVEDAAAGLPALPCSRPCPPPTGAADELRERVLAWLGLSQVGPKTVLCIPSKAIDAWLAAAVLGSSHPLLAGIECNLTVSSRLGALPKAKRIRKSESDYQRHAAAVTGNWAGVSSKCTQAERFDREVSVVVASTRSP